MKPGTNEYAYKARNIRIALGVNKVKVNVITDVTVKCMGFAAGVSLKSSRFLIFIIWMPL